MTRNRAYLLIQSLLCVLIALWLAVAAVRMYLAGAAIQASGELFYYIYTREKVAEQLMLMLPLVFGALGMTVAGWVLGVKDANADKPVQDLELQRNLICAHVQCPDDVMRRERTQQRLLFWSGWVAFAACMVPVALYTANGANFNRPLDTEADLYALLKVFVPFSALGTAILAITNVLRDRSFTREIDAAKALSATEKEARVNAIPATPQDVGRAMRVFRAAVFILAVALIVAGILNGGLEDVLTKANAICMECVGLG